MDNGACESNGDTHNKLAKKSARKSKYVSKLQAGITFKINRRGKLAAHMILPRILRNDIRRSYATMFANVYNTCDLKFMKSYLQKYYREDFYFLEREKDHLIDILKLKGLSAMETFWYDNMLLSNDFVFSISDVKLVLRSDQTSTMTCKFRIYGTIVKPRQEQYLAINFDQTSLLPRIEPVTIESYSRTYSVIRDEQLVNESRQNEYVMVKFDFSGEMCIYIDADCLIHAIEMYFPRNAFPHSVPKQLLSSKDNFFKFP